MATTTSITETPETPRRVELEPTPGGTAAFVRAVKIVCHRELLRFVVDRTRAVSSLVQPFFFLFVIGTGLRQLTGGVDGDLDFRTFVYPGIIAMSVLFTSMFSAMSIVWDREFGFLREMLVAPVPRSAIIVGKALGGATVATVQAAILIAVAGTVDIPYDPLMILSLLAQLFLLSFTVAAFGLVLAARVRQVMALMGVMNLVVMPLFYLSGAMYPLGNLPGWLQALSRFNPITYAVATMRHTVFAELDLTDAVRAEFDPRLTWHGWELPWPLCIATVAVLAVTFLSIAIAQFRRAE